MKAVWKFPWPYADGVVRQIEMPVGAEILSVQLQGQPAFWALVDPEAPKEKRTFRIVGTGHREVRDGTVYIGTVQDGGFVWHFFEETIR